MFYLALLSFVLGGICGIFMIHYGEDIPCPERYQRNNCIKFTISGLLCFTFISIFLVITLGYL